MNNIEYEALGKRIMLWSIQTQIIDILEDDTVVNKFEELCRRIVSISEAQDFCETIGNFNDLLLAADKFFIEDSKKLTKILDEYVKKSYK